MHKIPRFICRAIAVSVMLIMIFSMCLPATYAATLTQIVEKTYDIAVVFDNSGSMYLNTKAWCRAKYSMEIFASMLDYSKGDKLSVFPMWEVTTDGSKPAWNSGGSLDPFSVTKKEEINKISNMFTVTPDGTPYEPVTKAYNYLESSSATEKWLVVLTDGAFNQEKCGLKQQPVSIDKQTLESRLSALAHNSNNINVYYLGLDKAPALSGNPSQGFHTIKSTETSLMSDLINVCNTIFQRYELKGRLNNKKLTLDLSMKKIIVFVQGPNATVNSLTDSKGNKANVILDSGQRKYSEIRANDNPEERTKYSTAPIDTTLAGQVVTFDACPKGEYTLDYSNATNIQIFYEPDVDIVVNLTDSDGRKADFSNGEIAAGEYTVNYSLVDRITQEDAMKSGLLGDNVKLTAYLKQSADSEPDEIENGEKIFLEADENTELYVDGEYLDNYKISTKDTGSIPFPLKVIMPEESAFYVKAEVLQPQSWYKISDNENWEPVKATLLREGNPLTAEDFEAVKFEVAIENNLPYRCLPAPEESAYYIYICKDESGAFIKPESGSYKIDVNASFTDEQQRTLDAHDSEKFEIQKYDKFLVYLFWIFLILLILIIVWLILNHPVLPKSIYMNLPRQHVTNRVSVNGTRLGLSTSLFPGELKCEAKACTPLRNRSKRTAKFKIKSMSVLGSVTWFEIDGIRYTKGNNGKYVNNDGETVEESKPMIVVSDETEFRWFTNAHGTATGTIYINHN